MCAGVCVCVWPLATAPFPTSTLRIRDRHKLIRARAFHFISQTQSQLKAHFIWLKVVYVCHLRQPHVDPIPFLPLPTPMTEGVKWECAREWAMRMSLRATVALAVIRFNTHYANEPTMKTRTLSCPAPLTTASPNTACSLSLSVYSLSISSRCHNWAVHISMVYWVKDTTLLEILSNEPKESRYYAEARKNFKPKLWIHFAD